MRKLVLCGAVTACLFMFTVSNVFASRIPAGERDLQNKIWQRWWGTELEWRFDELPESAMVKKFRMPYAGAIYPDKNGGTERVLRKYDRAFYGRSQPATNFEQHDIAIHKEMKRGLIFRRMRTPHWAGHCNGWAAAAIRHAEPEKNVVRNGVSFSPADIKGLLAEVYTYTDIEELAGSNGLVHPAMLHVMLANWIGIGQHPIAMDESTDEEVWNYPIYGYSSSSAKRGPHRVEVKVNIGYVHYTDGEYNEAPDNHRFLYFHYSLDLNSAGEVVGGYYYRDSNQIDLLWVPLQPTQGGQTGNEPGNPYLDLKQVLSMWRESAPEEKRSKWYNINPTAEDAVVETEEAEDVEEAAETEAEQEGVAVEAESDSEEAAAEDVSPLTEATEEAADAEVGVYEISDTPESADGIEVGDVDEPATPTVEGREEDVPAATP